MIHIFKYKAPENGTIDARDTLSSIMKGELIVSDDSDFIDVCTRGTENKAYRIFLITF